MKLNRTITVGLVIALILTLSGCRSKEQRMVENIKDNISLEYHAELELVPKQGEGFNLKIIEMYDIANRPSEGHRIIGVRIADKEVDYKVIGADEYEYIEEPDAIRINLGTSTEFLPTQAGRFRIRLSRDIPVAPSQSGIFRQKLQFKPASMRALVEDMRNPEGFSSIELDEPDLGYIIFQTPTTAIGEKQPPGGRRSLDKRSVTYAIPADMTKLKPLVFTYFPSRSGMYVGITIMWIVNRAAWMVLGIILYVWWLRSREQRAKRKAELKMKAAVRKPVAKPPTPEKTGNSKT